jgi:hypothetical protein
MKFNFKLINNCVSISAALPNAIYKKCINSLLPCLAEPSAIFEGIELLLYAFDL